MRCIVFSFLLFVVYGLHAQGNPCLNPDSSKAEIYFQDSIALDTFYSCSDTVHFESRDVGAILWSIYPSGSSFDDVSNDSTFVVLDSNYKVKRTGDLILKMENECGLFRDTVKLIYAKPTLKFTDDTSIYVPRNIELDPIVNRKGLKSIISYNKTDFLDNPNTFNTFAENVSYSIEYIGTITVDCSQGGCITRDTLKINFIDSLWGPFLPQAFTPNNDGRNDIFYVRIGGEFRVNMIIYDRWERVIFTTNSKLKGWDGTYNGREMGAGLYAYVVYGTYIDKTPFIQKGKVTLLR